MTFDLPDQVAQIVHGDFLLPYERRNHPEVGIVEILAHHALQRLAAELLLADERIILVGAAIGLVSDVPFRLEADRKSTRLNSSHRSQSRMPSSA